MNIRQRIEARMQIPEFWLAYSVVLFVFGWMLLNIAWVFTGSSYVGCEVWTKFMMTVAAALLAATLYAAAYFALKDERSGSGRIGACIGIALFGFAASTFLVYGPFAVIAVVAVPKQAFSAPFWFFADFSSAHHMQVIPESGKRTILLYLNQAFGWIFYGFIIAIALSGKRYSQKSPILPWAAFWLMLIVTVCIVPVFVADPSRPVKFCGGL